MPTLVVGMALGVCTSLISNTVANLITQRPILEGALGAIVGGAISGAIVSSVPVIGGASYFKNYEKIAGFVKGAANYIGAFAESVVNETISYVEGKEITDENISESAKNILNDTVVNGSVSYLMGDVVGTDSPLEEFDRTTSFLDTLIYEGAAIYYSIAAIGSGISGFISVISDGFRTVFFGE